MAELIQNTTTGRSDACAADDSNYIVQNGMPL